MLTLPELRMNHRKPEINKLNIIIDARSEYPVYEQIKMSVQDSVVKGNLEEGTALPSINRLSRLLEVAPGTVIRAYEELRALGVITSSRGRGYFVAPVSHKVKQKVFVLFDRMNSYKEILFDSFIDVLGQNADVSVFFHHYDVGRFQHLIRSNKGRFSHYVVMPHLYEDTSRIIATLPARRLILVDGITPGCPEGVSAVYQDFESDMYQGLSSGLAEICRYNRIRLCLSSSRFQFVPPGCIRGFGRFCSDFNLEGDVLACLDDNMIRSGDLFIIFNDAELILALNAVKEKGLKLGRDVGIISYDDTPLKEILEGGIAVLSTDFRKMGQTAAEMVLGLSSGIIRNPFRLIVRPSLG